MSLGIRDLHVGGRYKAGGGYLIRTIREIEADMVYYVDQYGPGQCKKTTFIKRCVAIAEANEAPVQEKLTDDLKLAAPIPSPVIDRHVTNQLLSIALTLQNQTVSWIQTLKQTAEYHDAALAPAQREAVALIISDGLNLERRLELHRGALSGQPHHPA